jgi:ribosomal protein S18 acetylase RimI-like enzyme
MPDPFSIRAALREDFDALSTLWREVDELHAKLLPSYFRQSARAPKTRGDYDRILRALDERLLVGMEGRDVRGLVHVQLYDTPPVATMVPKRRAHVDSLAVEESARNRGLGRQLMDEAAIWARAHAAEEIVLTVWAGNDGAEHFYERLGFTRLSSVLSKAL